MHNMANIIKHAYQSLAMISTICIRRVICILSEQGRSCFHLHFRHSHRSIISINLSNEVFRLNLDQGKFLTSLQTTSKENTCCQINPVHELFTCGNVDGQVECWDPRVPKHISLLNCKANIDEFDNVSITTLKYRDGLNLAVGTSTGHVSKSLE
jgi:hypothetical protein